MDSKTMLAPSRQAEKTRRDARHPLLGISRAQPLAIIRRTIIGSISVGIVNLNTRKPGAAVMFFVAKFWERRLRPVQVGIWLGRESEQLADEVSLAERISFG